MLIGGKPFGYERLYYNKAFKTRLKHFKGEEFIAYMGISDAIAHVEGEAALMEFLKKVSDLLDTVRNDIGILLDVVLFSDHGNNFTKNRRPRVCS